MPQTVVAMVLEQPGGPLHRRELPLPTPAADQVLIEVAACGVCRTDLHLLDGELPAIHYPRVPGHQVVGRVLASGRAVQGLVAGSRVGLPWLGHTCGHCGYCLEGRENLCDAALFTGYQLDGGYATHCLAEADYVFPLPEGYGDLEVAPLLCGGLIGYRALRLCGEPKRLGLYGFGAAAHVIAQLARWQGREVYAYTRPGDVAAQGFARELGAVWAGGSDERAPVALDAAIIFAADGALVPLALQALRKGGRVVCGGIHMSDIPAFPYDRLWGERSVHSVANLTREDARTFFAVVPQAGLVTHTRTYALTRANEAVADHRSGALRGAAVLVP